MTLYPRSFLAQGCRRGSISALVVLALAGAVSASAQTPREFVCGEDFELHREIHIAEPEQLKLRPELPVGVEHTSQATINLNASPGLQANPAALTAWLSAVAIWVSWLEDNVTINLNADLIPLAGGILGSTSSSTWFAGYTGIRDQVVADREPDEAILAAMPTLAEFNLSTPPSISYTNDLSATKANLRALGYDMSFDDPNPDATINFNSNLSSSFDYDPSDGIDSNKFDFEAICVHELGHALGFISEVDYVDTVVNGGGSGTAQPTTLDLMRFRPGEGAADFTNNDRICTTGSLQPTQVFHDGITDLQLSTGSQLGDGRQASHWKADELTGTFLGIMDPTLAPGDREELTTNDIRAFGLIGWDTAPDCNGNTVPDGADIAAGTSQDCNTNGVPDECETDCNTNGVPDECDISAGFSVDANIDGVPDECQSLSVGDGAPIPVLRLWASPNPFRADTRITFELAGDSDVRIDVFDLHGRRVSRLAERVYPVGRHVENWDARDLGGRKVATGIYYVVARFGNDAKLIKLAVVR